MVLNVIGDFLLVIGWLIICYQLLVVASCYLLQGHSCKIGNMHVPGTSENQNHQFHEIHHFCLIFTFEYYIVAQKHIRQS